MKPFVLLGKRDALHRSVYGPGHGLPTMTIDEYLEEERLRGGILSAEPQIEMRTNITEEGNEGLEELERKEAIAWDDFKEHNPKGIGNTMNRG